MRLDWNNIFIKDLEWSVAGEITFRTLVMFILILLFLRLSGKKGVRQLSLFEVAVIIGLGSAAGDPMFNQENAILPAVVVFISILLFYRLLTWAASKSETFEKILEGEPLYIIEDGLFVLDTNHTEPMFAKDEFLAEMRQQSIEHLGQVKTAILETAGNVSFFYYPDEEVKPGLPVLPKAYNKKSKEVPAPGRYACTYCGHVEDISAGCCCQRCKKEEWVEAIQTLRLS
ncbi:DUF421 domain-containing protein [Mucilaginibacter robiniae]|uniref:DUF421 domain-containing protein n=1 Tax=Mucilaginibacter robiniae TaxID=2728022 RepID=A0A7L5DU59_9SPHI|nr:YetF domain-containing protein [Mucilaginibacter robiniae]QJD94645.1 DUF421 domain-containing protein [Mucilaginibacter robiniae]